MKKNNFKRISIVADNVALIARMIAEEELESAKDDLEKRLREWFDKLESLLLEL